MNQAFEQELHHFGPDGTAPTMTVQAATAYCRQFTAQQYENFTVVSWLLPRKLAQRFYPVYAWCRWADNLGDEASSPEEALHLLSWWEQELAACYEGRPRHPVTIALQKVVEDCLIPPQPFLQLIDAFRQDQHVREYDHYPQLLRYCQRSANPVGQLVLYLAEQYNAENAALSNNVCTALQLTNFWQDIRRDWENLQRRYLPTADCQQFGYSLDDFQQKRFTPQFQQLLTFQVDRAQRLFDAGKPLVGRLTGPIRHDVALFIRGGEAILAKIRQQNYDVWKSRPKLSKWGKISLLLGHLFGRWR
ncbi:MAG: squalene synthase HpnC [Zavarzinella sp.]